jgi:hypothetical protein
MAVEAKRGCGYRKAGGLYIVAGGVGEACERLPVPIIACPTCDQHVKQSRGFQWHKPGFLLAGAKPCQHVSGHCHRCAVCCPELIERNAVPSDKVGLIWVGEQFYPTPDDWAKEACKLGVSRRVSAIPKGLVVGRTWVLVAHPKAIAEQVKVKKEGELAETEDTKYTPAIFQAFVPERIELIVTPSMKKQEWVKELVEKQGVTLVEVPEDDPDHAPRAKKKSARTRAMEKHARKHAAKDKQEAV